MSLIVECNSIVKSFGKTKVIDSLSVSIESAELFFLLGPSGCGKTTLLRIIAGLETQDQGELRIDGKDMHSVAPEKRGLGMVFQNYALWPHMNVLQHIEFGLHSTKLSASQKRLRTQEVLDALRIAELAERYPHQLSGGQQQRVSLARAIAPQPRLLLLDEPLSNLDPKLREETRYELKQLQRHLSLTFLYVTHDRSEALSIGDRIALMNSGVIEQIGKPFDLYFRPKNAFVAEFLGESNILTAQIIANNGEVILYSEIGSLVLNNQLELRGEIKINLRPEDLKVSLGTRLDSSLATGVIKEILPMGALTYLKITTSSGTHLLSAIPSRESLDFALGSNVQIFADLNSICILE